MVGRNVILLYLHVLSPLLFRRTHKSTTDNYALDFDYFLKEACKHKECLTFEVTRLFAANLKVNFHMITPIQLQHQEWMQRLSLLDWLQQLHDDDDEVASVWLFI